MSPHERPEKITHPTLDIALTNAFEWALAFETTPQRALALTTLSDQLVEFRDRLAVERVVTARHLHEIGWSYTEIGGLLGVSRARACQLVTK